MNARYIVRSILIVWVLFALGPVRDARAAGSSPAYPGGGTVLSVEPLKPFPIGEQPLITVHLTTSAGQPLANRLIRVFNYGSRWRDRTTQALTDLTGTARIPITFYFHPGNYTLLVAFNGSDVDRLSASSSYV